MSKNGIFFGCCLLLLVACDYNGNSTHHGSAALTSTPRLLRAIPISDLTADVTLNGETTSYFGTDFPDGNWVIYLDIELGKEYPISIEWFALNALVMIQEGNLIAYNYKDIVNPMLTSTSEADGTTLFDYNCNQISNLSEIEAGDDPGEPGNPAGAECDNPVLPVDDPPNETGEIDVVNPTEIEIPPEPEEKITPRISQIFHRFTSEGLSERVNRFSQPVRVQLTNSNLGSGFGVALWTSTTPQYRVFIDFSYEPSSGKHARIFGSNGITVLAAEGLGADCVGSLCSIPFNWQEQQWYELIFEETTSTRWQTSILDPASGIKTTLGELITPANTDWIEASIGLSYTAQVRAADCATGLPPISIHFRGGTANEGIKLGAPRVTPPEKCVTWGAGASTNVISGDADGDIFTLTLGRI